MARYAIEGRSILITGGARGIGADAARRLQERGAQVAIIDRDPIGLDGALAFEGDVTDVAALERAVDGTVEAYGGIDVVIANAGISGVPATVATIDPADFERVIEINLLGVWRTVRAALPHVIERRGYVLTIASVAAVLPSPLMAAYVASKHGVEGFAKSLRMELAHTGTRVGVGYYSFIDTDMVRNALAVPAVGEAVAAVPGPLGKPIPVGAAGKAIVRGVERRAKNVYAPAWVPALLRARGLVGPIEALAVRHPRLARSLRAAETAAQGDGSAEHAPLSR